MVTSEKQSHFTRWLMAHGRAIAMTFKELIRAPFANMIIVAVIGVAIALPLGFFALLNNLHSVDSTWNISTPTISLFIKPGATPSQIHALKLQLQNNADIEKIAYVSPEDGLALLAKKTSLPNATALFQNNPIPAVITVFPVKNDQSPDTINHLYHALQKIPLVDIAQMDIKWVTRLYDMIFIGKIIMNALVGLFAFAVVLIIGHALHSSLSVHAREIRVMKLMGASFAYIRRPLLYRGFFYGLFGGACAWALVTLFFDRLQKPATQLAQTYHSLFHLEPVSLEMGFSFIAVSVLLGFFSAWLVIFQFLNKAEQAD